MFVTRAISMTNFLVASSALGFQVFVLYPWHKELDEGFEALKKEHLRVLDAFNNRAPARRTTVAKSEEGLRDILKLPSSPSLWRFITGQSSVPQASSSESSFITAVETPSPQYISEPPTAKPIHQLDGMALYSRYALAGAVCCSFTHAILTPVDIVKTRIQLNPIANEKRGLSSGLRQVVASEGASALTIGLGPTVVGYLLQGAFKFGGYEYAKTRIIDAIGLETASNNRHAVYLASSAVAEMAGDIALCPFEAVRIRLVSQPDFGRGLLDGFARIAREEGVRGLYAGLGPIMLKQVPYTMATFVVYEQAIDQAYQWADKSTVSRAATTGINIGAGLIAGAAAAFVSQPADAMLSKINKEKGEPGQGTLRRLWNIGREMGIRGSYAGFSTRLVMVGAMTAVQFAIYGDIKQALGATGGVEIN